MKSKLQINIDNSWFGEYSNYKGVDSILEHTLVENPDFSDTDKLTAEIEKGVLEFIADIEEFLSKN